MCVYSYLLVILCYFKHSPVLIIRTIGRVSRRVIWKACLVINAQESPISSNIWQLYRDITFIWESTCTYLSFWYIVLHYRLFYESYLWWDVNCVYLEHKCWWLWTDLIIVFKSFINKAKLNVRSPSFPLYFIVLGNVPK